MEKIRTGKTLRCPGKIGLVAKAVARKRTQPVSDIFLTKNRDKKMPQTFVLSFKQNLDITEESSGNFVFKLPQMNFNLKQLTPGLIAAINVLRGDGATEESLNELVLKTDGFSSLAKLYYYLEQFISLGIIS